MLAKITTKLKLIRENYTDSSMRNNIVKYRVESISGIWKLQGIRTGLERVRCTLNLRGKQTKLYY